MPLCSGKVGDWLKSFFCCGFHVKLLRKVEHCITLKTNAIIFISHNFLHLVRKFILGISCYHLLPRSKHQVGGVGRGVYSFILYGVRKGVVNVFLKKNEKLEIFFLNFI